MMLRTVLKCQDIQYKISAERKRKRTPVLTTERADCPSYPGVFRTAPARCQICRPSRSPCAARLKARKVSEVRVALDVQPPFH